ncbi:hypothetical protein [Longimicrobium sp.]|uniref:hypothetical protein n=1 Tax=Longimicrobium sp. TaxID=2029185 RepID=UPI002E37A28A|nr:hypothetical protein [Longimicrobium sp.]HEX6038137.1 hypothetical protein [Longimicrobium sp.]
MHRHTLPIAVLLLAACGSEPSADAARPVDAKTADSAAAPAVAVTPADSTAAAPVASAPAVVLARDGIELASGAGAPARLAFGAPREQVLARVGAVLGQPTRQGTMEECPSGPLFQATYAAGLQLSFQDSAFVGWFADEGSALRTAAGIGSGSSLAQLRAAYPTTKVEETSLGQEFDAGELYGIVTDTTAAGYVQVIFAGTNCIFR